MTAYLIIDVDDLLGRLQQRAFSIDLHELATKLRNSAALVAGLPSADALKAIAAADWTVYQTAGSNAEQIFETIGFEPFDVPDPQYIADALILNYFKSDPQPVDELIIVGTNPALLAMVKRIKMSKHARVRVWADTAPDNDDVIYQPLESVLGIQTKLVSLYIDFENIAISLHEQGFAVNLERVIEGLSQHAMAHGQVIHMAAYAPWGQRGSLPPMVDSNGREVSDEGPSRLLQANIDPVITLPGKNSADMRIAKDLLAESAQPGASDIFIIASGDRDFNEVFTALRARNKQVLVWGVRGSTSRQLENNPALQVEYLDDFLGLQRYQAMGQILAAPLSAVANAANAFTPSQWTSVVYQYDRIAPRHATEHGVPSTLLQEQLRAMNAVVSAQRGHDLITQAVAMGILKSTRVGGTDYVKPAEDHSIVQRMRLVRDRIVMRVANTLDVRGWEYVNYGFLLKGLAMDRELEQPGLNADDSWRSDWVDCLVREGILVRELVPHRHNPEDLVPVIRLTDELPLIAETIKAANPTAYVVSYDDLDPANSLQVLRDAETNAMMKRIAVSVDQFTSYRNFTWCPLGSLHRRLRAYDSGVTFQRAVEWLIELGAVAVNEYENPESAYRTKGISLNPDIPLVHEILVERNGFICLLLRQYENRAVITLASLMELCPEVPEAVVQLWLSIMEAENVLNPVPGKAATFSLFRTHHTVNQVADLCKHIPPFGQGPKAG